MRGRQTPRHRGSDRHGLGVVNTLCFVGSLLIPVLVGKILDVSGSFPVAFIACAACEALALVSGAFTREMGLRRRPVMVT